MESPILQSPNWDLPFVIMCDASDFAVGAVLGQRSRAGCDVAQCGTSDRTIQSRSSIFT